MGASQEKAIQHQQVDYPEDTQNKILEQKKAQEEPAQALAKDFDQFRMLCSSFLVPCRCGAQKSKNKNFDEQFGKYLKMGVQEDATNIMNVAEFMRYFSSKSGDERISFKYYVDRMHEDHQYIYHITGESIGRQGVCVCAT